MKKYHLPMLCSLPLLLANCSSLGIYDGKHVYKARQEGLAKGIAEEKARAARAQYMAQQADLEKSQPKSTYYDIPVEAHTTSDGVKYEATRKTIKITNR